MHEAVERDDQHARGNAERCEYADQLPGLGLQARRFGRDRAQRLPDPSQLAA
jgi:hypothetical protein